MHIFIEYIREIDNINICWVCYRVIYVFKVIYILMENRIIYLAS